jgi:diguanylate cyclase (GGDEF)-like protein
MAPLDRTVTSLPRTDALTLEFHDDELERKFRADYMLRVRAQSRNALLLGAFLYAVFGLLDMWSTPETMELFWTIRAGVIVLILCAFFITLLPHSAQYQQLIMVLATLAGGAGIVAMVLYGTIESSSRYYVGLTVVVVFTCQLSGLRAFYSLLVTVLVLVMYTLVVVVIRPIPVDAVVNSQFFLVAVAVVSIAAGYTMERYRRTMFFQTMLLDQERRRSESFALHDSLTGLPNRVQFDRILQRTISRAQRHGAPFALLFVDIDNFKPINDSYGHCVGDLVLREIARRLRLCLRDIDVVARLGGDEFLILIEDLTHREGVQLVSERILELLARPLVIPGTAGVPEIIISTISASIGISLYPSDSESTEGLLRRADAAMYCAKKSGHGGYCFASQPAA